jgi:hypothetical protein
VFIALVGLFFDATNGFIILKKSKNIISGAFGIIAFGILYLAGEAGVEYLNSKDKASNPLIKRAFHLLMILTLVCSLIAVSFLIF